MSHAKQTEQDARRVEKLGRKRYEQELARLQGELVRLQEWVVREGVKVCIVFEGRDTAGKGGVIKRITERVSPRVFRVVALPAPTDREKSQMYVQRYLQHFPAAGEVVIFDRSWYNRAGVERVMGFCSEDDAVRFLALAPLVERAMVDSGIILLKYWLEVSQEEQTRRIESRINDPRKVWKLSPMDLKSYNRWYAYSRARDEMFAATNTEFAPWHVADSNDKEARAAEHHQPPARAAPLRLTAPQARPATSSREAKRLPRARLLPPVHPSQVLTPRCLTIRA